MFDVSAKFMITQKVGDFPKMGHFFDQEWEINPWTEKKMSERGVENLATLQRLGVMSLSTEPETESSIVSNPEHRQMDGMGEGTAWLVSGTWYRGNAVQLRVSTGMSVVIKFDGLIFKFGDGRQGKTRKQNGICIATDAVGI